jgi:hypothetical protein
VPAWKILERCDQRLNFATPTRNPARRPKKDPGFEDEILEVKYFQRETPRIKAFMRLNRLYQPYFQSSENPFS